MSIHSGQPATDNRLVDAIISDMKASLAQHRRKETLLCIKELSNEQKALLDLVLIQKTPLQKAAELLGLSQEIAASFYADALHKIRQSATFI